MGVMAEMARQKMNTFHNRRCISPNYIKRDKCNNCMIGIDCVENSVLPSLGAVYKEQWDLTSRLLPAPCFAL
jgi:hypothetical protein